MLITCQSSYSWIINAIIPAYIFNVRSKSLKIDVYIYHLSENVAFYYTNCLFTDFQALCLCACYLLLEWIFLMLLYINSCWGSDTCISAIRVPKRPLSEVSTYSVYSIMVILMPYGIKYGVQSFGIIGRSCRKVRKGWLMRW